MKAPRSAPVAWCEAPKRTASPRKYAASHPSATAPETKKSRRYGEPGQERAAVAPAGRSSVTIARRRSPAAPSPVAGYLARLAARRCAWTWTLAHRCPGRSSLPSIEPCVPPGVGVLAVESSRPSSSSPGRSRRGCCRRRRSHCAVVAGVALQERAPQQSRSLTQNVDSSPSTLAHTGSPASSVYRRRCTLADVLKQPKLVQPVGVEARSSRHPGRTPASPDHSRRRRHRPRRRTSPRCRGARRSSRDRSRSRSPAQRTRRAGPCLVAVAAAAIAVGRRRRVAELAARRRPRRPSRLVPSASGVDPPASARRSLRRSPRRFRRRYRRCYRRRSLRRYRRRRSLRPDPQAPEPPLSDPVPLPPPSPPSAMPPPEPVLGATQRPSVQAPLQQSAPAPHVDPFALHVAPWQVPALQLWLQQALLAVHVAPSAAHFGSAQTPPAQALLQQSLP